MKAVRLYGPLDFRVDDIPMPKPGVDEVLVRTEYCGICGSDIGRGVNASGIPHFPNTIGHEFSATVVEVGENVTNVKAGDLVAVIPVIACQQCPHCKMGNYGQCLNLQFIGLRVPDKGAFAEYNTVPAINCLKLPEGINPVLGAFIEPTAVAFHTLKRVDFKPGKDLAIIGAGMIGQLIILAAKAMGVKELHVFDMDPQKLEFAKTLGADYTYNTSEEGFMEAYMKKTDGLGIEQVMEVVGIEQTILMAVDICRVRGHIALVGLLGKSVNFSPEYLRKINTKELTLTGCFHTHSLPWPGDEWELSIFHHSKGLIDLKKMIYKIDRMENANKAFEEYKTPGKVQGKYILTFNNID